MCARVGNYWNILCELIDSSLLSPYFSPRQPISLSIPREIFQASIILIMNGRDEAARAALGRAERFFNLAEYRESGDVMCMYLISWITRNDKELASFIEAAINLKIQDIIRDIRRSGLAEIIEMMSEFFPELASDKTLEPKSFNSDEKYFYEVIADSLVGLARMNMLKEDGSAASLNLRNAKVLYSFALLKIPLMIALSYPQGSRFLDLDDYSLRTSEDAAARRVFELKTKLEGKIPFFQKQVVFLEEVLKAISTPKLRTVEIENLQKRISSCFDEMFNRSIQGASNMGIREEVELAVIYSKCYKHLYCTDLIRNDLPNTREGILRFFL